VVLVGNSLLLVGVLVGRSLVLVVEIVLAAALAVVLRVVPVPLASWKLASLVGVVRLAFLVPVVLEVIRLVLF